MNIMPSKYTVAEFFSGCGGLSRGFSRTNRFNVVFGNDIKKFALETFRLNHTFNGTSPITLQKDIRLITDSELVQTFENLGIGVGELDCLVGGPPCQGFSQMRRAETRKDSKIVRFGGYNMLDEDPRNDLVLRFLEIVAALSPKVVVIENVPQFLSHYHNGKKGGIAEQVESVLNDLEYEMDCDVLNAADYGVPQLRERAIIIASRIGKIKLPKPSHHPAEMLPEPGKGIWVSVADAIADLPSNAPLSDTLGGKPSGYEEVPITSFAQLMRTSEAFPYNHVTRSYRKSVLKIIAHMQQGETWESASARMRGIYQPILDEALLIKGENRDDAIRRLDLEGKIIGAFYKEYYSSAYTRLDWNRPALTITASANFLGSGRYTHPELDRGITMREAARLQSFDDAFTFYTSDDGTRTENVGIGLDMIGEAVPPLLAQAIASQIISHLDQNKVNNLPSSSLSEKEPSAQFRPVFSIFVGRDD